MSDPNTIFLLEQLIADNVQFLYHIEIISCGCFLMVGAVLFRLCILGKNQRHFW